MKKLLTLATFILTIDSIAQTAVSDIAGYTPNPKAVLDINSTSKGLLLPRLTSAQRIAIAPTASQAGLTVFDTNTKSQWFFDGTVWKEMAGGFSLPYSGTNNNGSNALEINNTVGRAAYFQSPNSVETMRVYNSGTGDAITADGHLNVTGTIKANGVAGTQNQILTTNSSGNLAWGDVCNYKNFRQFLANGTWTVPADVTRIMIEVWGSGGGGNGSGITEASTINPGPGCGGGGGAYGKALFNVTPGETVTITLGIGGAGATGGITPVGAINGQSSSVATISRSILVLGGLAGTSTLAGLGGTTFSVSGPVNEYLFIRGKSGEYVKTVFSQSSATDFWQENFYGNGGDAGNSPGSGGIGGSYKRNITTLAAGVAKPALNGQNYGGGGGGGHGPAAAGLNGTAIIYY